MIRWLPPEKAARCAERAAKDAAQRQTARRRCLMLIVDAAFVSVGLIVADYFWLRLRAKQKYERPDQRQQRRKLTSNPAFTEPQISQNMETNHE